MRTLLTFLGTNDYIDCYYSFEDKRSSYGKFVQSAILEMFFPSPVQGRLVVFMTEEARMRNWENRTDKNGDLYIGLKETLEKAYPELSIKTVEISSGQSEEDNWKLFELLYSVIRPGDEIYFDVTHGFRSFPIMAIIMLNYARLLKQAKVGKVLYGSFETLGPAYLVQTFQPEQRVAPIIDLSSMVTLLDWTNGIDSFLRTADASMIQYLTESQANPLLRQSKGQDQEAKQLRELANKLDTLSKSFSTCRGQTLQGEIENVKVRLSKAKILEVNRIRPLGKLLDKLEQKMNQFSEHEIMNLYKMIDWCLEHHLIQQGYTFLQENLITAICKVASLDPTKRENRKLAAGTIIETIRNMAVSDQKEIEEGNRETVERIREIISPFRETLKQYDTLIKYRNNINHAEMNEERINYKNFSEKLRELMLHFKPLFEALNDAYLEKMLE